MNIQNKIGKLQHDSEPLHIAQIMGIMNSGGVEAVVMNYYRALDRTKVQFDFFVDETCSFPQRDEIERLGGRYFLIPPYSHVFSYVRTLKRLFKQNGYQTVHAHNNTINVFPLLAAFMAGVPRRICHNHSTASWGEGLKTLLKYVLRPFSKVFATDYFACSEKAGRWMYGDRYFNAGKVRVMTNAIDKEKFVFDPEARKRLRKELGIGDDAFVVGHVGRFTYAKNHAFLIDIFDAVHRKKPDSYLLLIGEGELQRDIQIKVSELGLDGCVLFLGIRKDVNKLYSAMDAFCLPSYYEGLSVVGIESQTNGLACSFSDFVPVEIKLTDRVVYLSLRETAEVWADNVLKPLDTNRDRASAQLQGYDIADEAYKLQTFYVQAQS